MKKDTFWYKLLILLFFLFDNVFNTASKQLQSIQDPFRQLCHKIRRLENVIPYGRRARRMGKIKVNNAGESVDFASPAFNL